MDREIKGGILPSNKFCWFWRCTGAQICRGCLWAAGLEVFGGTGHIYVQKDDIKAKAFKLSAKLVLSTAFLRFLHI